MSISGGGDGKFHFAIDRGGTFTDVHVTLPDCKQLVTKLLSVDPANYPDAPTEGIRRILNEHDLTDGPNSYPRGALVKTDRIGSIRMGTTVATNSLLERNGAPMALLITKGFKDLLEIGNQSRPDIFDLTIERPSLLYSEVVEIDERLMLSTYLTEATSNKSEEEKKEGTAEALATQSYYDNDGPYPAAGVGPRVQSITGETFVDLKVPDLDVVKQQLLPLLEKGLTSLAVVLLHSFALPTHEKMIGKLALDMGFTEVALSSEVMPMVKLTSRGHTACAAAYLTPSIKAYLGGFTLGFDEGLRQNVQLDFMKSDGGLTPVDDFGGHQGKFSASVRQPVLDRRETRGLKGCFASFLVLTLYDLLLFFPLIYTFALPYPTTAILSGPAGGVIGYAKTAFHADPNPRSVIGFDMGGTSTDVSRYDGQLEHVFETTTAGISIQAPQLDIHTVAAGGGSRLFLRRGMFVVGPESAGAHPGPVCYRKGGHLAVTDANLVLGRVIPSYFPHIFGPNEDEALDLKAAQAAFADLAAEHSEEAQGRPVEELAFGFLQVANEAMCRPIRNLTQMRGFDITSHVLACFGGAGPQHACAMAKALGMKRVKVHRFGGVLSAYGLSLADAVQDVSEPTAETFIPDDVPSVKARKDRLDALAEKAVGALLKQGYHREQVRVERYLNMRCEGTDNAIMVLEGESEASSELGEYDFSEAFSSHYRREFGFELTGRDILMDDYRIRAVVPGPAAELTANVESIGAPTPIGQHKVYFETGWEQANVYKVEDLEPGHVIDGPALIIQPISTVVLEIDCTAQVTAQGDLDIAVGETVVADEKRPEDVKEEDVVEDPVMLSIFGHRFMGIAEQMGRTLARTAISVNMKERLDFSCALFTPDGGLVANAPHIPVHLGAMQSAVNFQVQYWNTPGQEGIHEGDVLVSNHPQLAGGSHLPDITVITPVFHKGRIIFFVASRGHHADIGGVAPGSMPPHSKSLEEEGAMIVAFKLVRNGIFQEEGITEILQAPGKLPGNFGTRNLRDNLSDLRAQVAANNSGIKLLQHLVEEHGLVTVQCYMKFIQHNAEHAVRSMLREFVAKHGSERAHAIDYMDDGSPIELTIHIDRESGSATFDFTGTGPQVLNNHNAPPAVTYSAVIYSLRCLVGQAIPLNQGCLAPITFVIPKYSLLNPSNDAGVVGGNVLTSQRLVDVVLKAFQACAASQGCMNNLTFGDKDFGYYETIAGGAGAGPGWAGKR
jgi:5-oxoprolinase (ATP-hydrolysing)